MIEEKKDRKVFFAASNYSTGSALGNSDLTSSHLIDNLFVDPEAFSMYFCLLASFDRSAILNCQCRPGAGRLRDESKNGREIGLIWLESYLEGWVSG